MIADTSIGAYHQLKYKQNQYDRILEYIDSVGTATIAMTARALNMEKSTVSARINALVNPKKGEPQLELAYKGKCPITKIYVKFWRLPSTGQAEFYFDEVV